MITCEIICIYCGASFQAAGETEDLIEYFQGKDSAPGREKEYGSSTTKT